MHLPVLILVLAAILAAEFAPHACCSNPEWRLMLCAFTVFVCAYVVTLLGDRFDRQLQPLRPKETQENFLLCIERVFQFCWVIAAMLILWSLQWPQLVLENFGLREWVFVDEFLILLPVLVPVVFATYVHSRLLASQTIDERKSATGKRRFTNRHHRLFADRIRIQFLLIVVPTLAFCGIRDVIALSVPNNDATSYGDVQRAAASLVPMLFVVCLMPMLLRLIWKTQSLKPTELGSRLMSVCDEAGVRIDDVRLWNTNYRVTNAAVIGVIPGMRHLLVSDALIHRFSDEQIDAIARHETAHLLRGHLISRIVVLLAPLSFLFTIYLLTGGSADGFRTALDTRISGGAVGQILLAGALCLYAVVAMAVASRLFEFEADLLACCADGKQYRLNDRRLADYRNLLRTMQTLNGDQVTWLHPKPSARITLLDLVAADRSFCKRLLTNGRRLTRLVYLMVLLAPLLALAGKFFA